MFTRRPVPHQQQQPARDRIAQQQQQAGACEFQHRAQPRPGAQLGEADGARGGRPAQH